MLASVSVAETAAVRILKGRNFRSAAVVETRTVELEKLADARWRFTMPKGSVPADVQAIEVVPAFMTARKGESGYWINGRGVYGNFDRDDGENRWGRSHMPLYGLKRGGTMHWAQMKTYRFDYDLVVRAAAGRYEIFPCVRFDRVREFFPLYDDVVIEFSRLDGEEADYNGIAHAYRRQRLSRGEIEPIRERMKRQSELGYLSEAMVIRLQTHGAKSIPEKRTDFYPTNEPPINVYLPFDKAEDFVRAIRAAGVDKAAFVSAGWNAGGYDGRLPDHFPVEPAFGGEKGLRQRMVFSCRPDGSEPHLALPWRTWAKGGHHLNFHPDSRTVTMNLVGADGKLYLMKFDVFGAKPTLLCGPVRGSGHPSVSPDGRYLVTDAYLGEPVAAADGTVPIRLVDLATGNEREIARVSTVTGERFKNGEFRVDPHPAWSRDGKSITFNAFEGGTRRVLMVRMK